MSTTSVQTKEITWQLVRSNPEVKALLSMADQAMEIQGYTEHGDRHAKRIGKESGRVLEELGFSGREVRLARIAGYMHDIGNVINREGQAQTGALLAHGILTRMDMPPADIAEVLAAIGNHHEEDGSPVSNVSAALILCDKADVHSSRVRNLKFIKFDIHDRVNYAAKRSTLLIDRENKTITLSLEIDTSVAPVMEYFEIFMSRMLMSRRAAEFLGCQFQLLINGTKIV
jgi:metal-dependent HD superfamily phosphatase/phosphodiesterase